MFESFAAGLVEKYVAPYADVDLELLRVAVREGKVTLTDVKLKTAAFDSLGFPLTVRGGRVGEVQVDVTWSALTAKPAKLHMRDITVVLGPSGSETSAEMRHKRLALLQSELLREDEEARILRQGSGIAPSAEEQSFGMRFTAAAIGALQIEMTNVHVRYEDAISDTSSPPFAFGITLDKLSLFSVDGQWRATADSQAQLAAVANKMLQVEGLALYWQHGDASVGASLQERLHIKHDSAAPAAGDPYHILAPLSLSVKMTVNRMGVPSNGSPRMSGHISIQGKACVNVECAAMRDVSCVVDAAIAHENRMRQIHPRPDVGYREGARKWWAYACACVREEVRERKGARSLKALASLSKSATSYVTHFTKLVLSRVDMSKENSFSQDEEKFLRELEARLPVQMVLALRGRCEELVEEARAKEQEKEKEKEKEQASGWLFARLFRGWRKKEGVSVEVGGKAVGSGVTDGAFGLPMHMQLEIAGVYIMDYVAEGSAYPRVMALGAASATTAKPSKALHIRFEDKAPNSTGAYLLEVATGGGTMVYSSALVRRIYRHLEWDLKVNMSAALKYMSRSTAASVEQQRLMTQRAIRQAVEHRLPLDVRLDVRLPDIVFPETTSAAAVPSTSVVVYQMGYITAASSIQPGEPAAGSYDRCEVTWKGWSVLACAATDKWAGLPVAAAERLLVVGDMTWVFDVSVARKDMEHTVLVFKLDVPTVRVRCSATTLQRATAVSVAVYGDVASKPAVEIDHKEVSTMVGLAGGGVRMLESGWDTCRRREMPVMTAHLRRYASWTRVDARISVAAISVSLWDKPAANAVERQLVGLEVRGVAASGLVRSLDATAAASVTSVELEDLVQRFGDAHKHMLRSSVAGCGRGEEALITARVHVWNSKSPDRNGLDVELEGTLAQLYVGPNLETLGVLQNCVAVALEAGIVQAQALAREEGREEEGGGGVAAGEVPAVRAPVESPTQMVMAAMQAAGSAVVHAGTAKQQEQYTQVGSRLALKFVGYMHAVDVALVTSRSDAVFPVARLSVRACEMINEESRAGRIEVNASIGAITVMDLTPAASKWPVPIAFTDAVAAGMAALPAAKIAAGRYVHYSRRERKAEASDALLQVTVGRIDLVACPRIISEVMAYVYKSAVFRSNFAALWAASSAASSSVKWRQRLDSEAMSYRYKLLLSLGVGGLRIVCPECSASDDHCALVVPPLLVANHFTDTAECCEAATTVSLSSSIHGVEQGLINFPLSVAMKRQLLLRNAGDAAAAGDTAVMHVEVEVGTIAIQVSQPQVALIWRSAFAHVAEVKAAWSWQSAGGAKRSKSVLEIAPIRKLLDGAFQDAAEKARVRQAASERASAHLLDLRLHARLEALHLSLLANSGAALARLEILQAQAHMSVWSDTAWQAAGSVAAVYVRDVEENSTNVFKTLLAPAWRASDAGAGEGAGGAGEVAKAPFFEGVYDETPEGDGDMRIACVGLTVTLVVDPIFKVLTNVFDAFSDPEDKSRGAPLAVGGEAVYVVAAATVGGGEPPEPPQVEPYAWWGGSKVQGTMQVGLCEVCLVQDCTDEKSVRMTLAFCADADYLGSASSASSDLHVQDVTIYTLLGDGGEALTVLEKTPLTLMMRGTYSATGVDQSLSVLVRSFDLVITYQDTKRIYGLVKGVLDSAKKSGFNTSNGFTYFSSLLDREAAADDAAVAPPAPLPPHQADTVTKLVLHVHSASLSIINDCMGWTVPFLTLYAKNASLDFAVKPDQSAVLKCAVTVESSFYNLLNSCFEPLVEPWSVKVEALEAPARASAHVTVSAETRVEINISEMHMRALVQTVEGWLQDSKTWGQRDLTRDEVSPYRLRNESGVPLTFWLGSSYEAPAERALIKELAAGGEAPFEFSQKRALQVRQRDFSVDFHTLSIKFEGVKDVLTHVPVDMIGVHMLPLGDLRAVAEIHNDSGCKIIAIQSTFKVYNKTSLSVDACVLPAAQSEGAGEALESLAQWHESFASECHGCVPLHLSGAPYMAVRPSGGKFGYCSPFPVPVEPVTGESQIVCCQPAEGSDEAQAMYFRVRLDAKRPVGGHEEKMRIVISIHSAFRVQNAVPYELKTVFYAGSDAKTEGVEVSRCCVKEGSCEQLYCADLKSNIQMTAMLHLFVKPCKPVKVFDAGGGKLDKTMQVVDEAGSILHLGVETTFSAWGDLTVVVYAQYLIRNFSQLPLIYGVTKPAGKVAAGQTDKPASGGATNCPPSPEKNAQATPDRHHDSVFQAIYAVFGPRSPFSGTVVMCEPPLADSAISNADKIRGNIAIVRRGVIPFTEKARKVSAAGAIGVIFINTDDTTFLAEGDKGPGIRLPSVMLPKTEGEMLAKSAQTSPLSVHVTPESASRSQRATSQLLEWKRAVKAAVRVEDAGVLGGTPEKVSGESGGGSSMAEMAEALWGGGPKHRNESDKDKGKKELAFPDSWMELPGEPPFMFSYMQEDLTGNKASFMLPGSEWAPAFSLESMGTTGVLQVPGAPSELPALNKAKPVYEFGLSFELGSAQFSRSKVCSIMPRFTVCNQLGFTLQLVQAGLEDEPNVVVELADGCVAPFHWVDSSKLKQCRARVVPSIGTHETFATAWSGLIDPQQVGSFSMRFPPDAEGCHLNVLVEVRLRRAATFIIFRVEKEDKSLYAIINRSGMEIEAWQQAGKTGGAAPPARLKIGDGARAPLAWDRPMQERTLVLKASGMREEMLIKMDQFGHFKFGTGAASITAEVFADGSTRAVRLSAANTAGASVTGASSRGDGDDEALARYSLVLKLAGVGVSLIDSKMEEVLYFGALGINLSYRMTRSDFETEFKIRLVQIDNQTDNGPEVILAPEKKEGEKDDESNTIHLSMVKSREYKDMAYFKYFAFQLKELNLDLEETFIMRLLDAAQNVVDSSTITVPDEKQEDLRSSGYTRLRFLRKEYSGGEKMYFELFQLHPIQVNLSFFGTGAILERASTEGGGLSYNPMFAAMKALGVVITNIDRAPICLNALMLERPFASSPELISSIKQHYRSQVIAQLYKLVGSFEFLGNPVGLVNNLGTGVKDFFYEPAQGIMKSPSDFAKGMQKGSLSLFTNSTYGVFNAASKITGSVSKSLVQLSCDSDYVKKRAEAQSDRLKKGTNLSNDTTLTSEVQDGFMGIFAKPMAGAREGGASGFFSGLGKGLLGAVVKPTAGLMDLASKATEVVSKTSKGSEVAKRLRPPRASIPCDGILRQYDARSAHGCDSMRRLRDGEWKDHRYVGFCVLEGSEAVLVTDKHLCVHCFHTHQVVWELAVGKITSVAVAERAVSVEASEKPVKQDKSSVALQPMSCADARYAEYLADVIRRAVSLESNTAATAEGLRRANGGRARSGEYML